MDELLDRVQASKTQILDELDRLGAVNRDGWKLVTDMEKVAQAICMTIGMSFIKFRLEILESTF